MSAKPSESSSSVWFATGIIKNPSERIVKVGGIVPKLAIWLLDMVWLGKGGGGWGWHDSHGQ